MIKTGIDVFEGINDEILYPLAREAGFEAFFSPPEIAHDFDAMKALKTKAEALGFCQETSHSTIPGCVSVGREGQEGDAYIDVLLKNIDNCARLAVPVLVVHPQCFSMNSIERRKPDIGLGLSRLCRVVEAAGEAGVRIAFENTDSPELLNAVMEYFTEEHVGFCYDSGHENWLTPGIRWLRKYGDRLFCTHLNDNDGTFDHHWIPYDGNADFDLICEELRDCRLPETLSAEVAYRGQYRENISEKEYLERCNRVIREIVQRIE